MRYPPTRRFFWPCRRHYSNDRTRYGGVPVSVGVCCVVVVMEMWTIDAVYVQSDDPLVVPEVTFEYASIFAWQGPVELKD